MCNVIDHTICFFMNVYFTFDSPLTRISMKTENESMNKRTLTYQSSLVPFVKCARPDGLKLLQIRMICNLQVELARSTGANSLKIKNRVFFLQKTLRDILKCILPLWDSRSLVGAVLFHQQDWRWKGLLGIIECAKSQSLNFFRVWPFFLVVAKHENTIF